MAFQHLVGLVEAVKVIDPSDVLVYRSAFPLVRVEIYLPRR